MTYDLIITDSHVMTPNGMVEKNLVIEEESPVKNSKHFKKTVCYLFRQAKSRLITQKP